MQPSSRPNRFISYPSCPTLQVGRIFSFTVRIGESAKALASVCRSGRIICSIISGWLARLHSDCRLRHSAKFSQQAIWQMASRNGDNQSESRIRSVKEGAAVRMRGQSFPVSVGTTARIRRINRTNRNGRRSALRTRGSETATARMFQALSCCLRLERTPNRRTPETDGRNSCLHRRKHANLTRRTLNRPCCASWI